MLKRLELFFNMKDVQAKAIYENGTLTILKGSKASKNIRVSLRKSQEEKRQNLLDAGVIKEEKEYYTFIEDYQCNSPSSGSNLISGSSTNGLICWKNSEGKKLKTLLIKD